LGEKENAVGSVLTLALLDSPRDLGEREWGWGLSGTKGFALARRLELGERETVLSFENFL
jgi:hypothetical protein